MNTPEKEPVYFADLGLSNAVLDALDAMNFLEPTPIQEAAIPAILDGKDMIACAQTGTGKTAAFVLPMLHTLAERPTSAKKIGALIVVPTRELAIQIDQQITGFSYFVPVSSTKVYGGGDGDDFAQQKTALKEGADIVVATPGKLISHLNLGYVDLSELRYFALDEADRMLDMGFHADIMQIYSYVKHKSQCLMFSATMPKKIRQLADQILEDPLEISLALSKPAQNIVQAAFLVDTEEQKLGVIAHLLKDDDLDSVIVFTATKRAVTEVVKRLRDHKLSVEGISSDLAQDDREELMRKFKNKQVSIIVATDIISRGIDIDSIEMVINYSVPPDPEDYIHRIGRTARAQRSGEAVTLVDKADQGKLQRIEQLIEKDIRKVPLFPHLGESPDYDPKRYGRDDRRGRSGGGGSRNSKGGGHRSGGVNRNSRKSR